MYYSPTKRKLKSAVSVLVSTVFLVFSSQGTQLAEPGDIFDASSSWKCLLPVILRSVVVNFMNQMYRKAAEVLESGRITSWLCITTILWY